MQRILSTVCVVWSLAVSADPLEASIEELQAQLSSDTFSSVDLVDWYVARVEAYDQQGPALNAIQHMNDNARAQDSPSPVMMAGAASGSVTRRKVARGDIPRV